MAFKMKGSAYKMGNVATKTVLKHKAKASQEEYDTNHPGPGMNPKEKGYHTGHEKDGSPIPMKSALKQYHKEMRNAPTDPVTSEEIPKMSVGEKGLTATRIRRDKEKRDYSPGGYGYVYNPADTKGRGKKKYFAGNIPAQTQWIKDTHGRSVLHDKAALRKAKIEYYNLFGPKETEVKETPQQYTGQTYEKETRYPTNKDIRQ